MERQVIFGDKARDLILKGVDLVADTVKVTIGPKGRNVILDKIGSLPVITNDGVTIAKDIEVPEEANIGATLLKQAAIKTNDVVGDGTTTATILAQAMVKNGMKLIASGHNPVGIKNGITMATNKIIETLHEEYSQPIETKEDIKRVATISSNDTEIGELIAEAMEQVGRTGVITVEESKGITTDLSMVEGMEIERGCLSPYMITDQTKMEAILEDPYILLVDRKLTVIEPELIQLFDEINRQGHSLLIVCEGIEGEALTLLIVNKMRGTFRSVGVIAPGYGEMRKSMMQDIAVLTGGTYISKELGREMNTITITDLGRAQKVRSTRNSTTIIGGMGDHEEIKKRIAQIENEMQDPKVTSPYDMDTMHKRIGRLSGGVAIIEIGAPTEIEMKEKKFRVEDALNSTRAAIEEGIIAGGGTTLFKISNAISVEDFECKNDDEKAGVQIVLEAIQSPAWQIADNAGYPADVVLNNIGKHGEKTNIGFDASTGEYVDMIAAGIIDPTKVVRTALQNAASIAGMLLTTESVVASIPAKK